MARLAEVARAEIERRVRGYRPRVIIRCSSEEIRRGRTDYRAHQEVTLEHGRVRFLLELEAALGLAPH